MGVGVTRKLVQWLDREKLIHADDSSNSGRKLGCYLTPRCTQLTLPPARTQGPAVA